MIQHVELQLFPIEKIFPTHRALNVFQLLSLQRVLLLLQRLPVQILSFLTHFVSQLCSRFTMMEPTMSLDVEEEGKPPVTVRTVVRVVQLGVVAAGSLPVYCSSVFLQLRDPCKFPATTRAFDTVNSERL